MPSLKAKAQTGSNNPSAPSTLTHRCPTAQLVLHKPTYKWQQQPDQMHPLYTYNRTACEHIKAASVCRPAASTRLATACRACAELATALPTQHFNVPPPCHQHIIARTAAPHQALPSLTQLPQRLGFAGPAGDADVKGTLPCRSGPDCACTMWVCEWLGLHTYRTERRYPLSARNLSWSAGPREP